MGMRAEIITDNGRPAIRAFDRWQHGPQLFAFDPAIAGVGVIVGTADLNGDGHGDVGCERQRRQLCPRLQRRPDACNIKFCPRIATSMSKHGPSGRGGSEPTEPEDLLVTVGLVVAY